MRVKVEEIKLKDRFRKDMGNLKPLADSIERLGLMQPVGVAPDMTLVFGERRFRAIRDVLKRDVIDVRVLDIGKLVEKEHDENEMRKDFTASERVSIADAVAAEIGKRQGQRTDKLRQKIVEVDEDTGSPTKIEGRSADIAAQKAGFGNRETYRQAKAVVENAEPELVEAMDSKVVSISTAAKLAKADPEDQRAVAQASDDKRKAEVHRTMSKLKQDLADIEDKTPKSIWETRVVNSFESIAKARIKPGQFAVEALPAERKIILDAIPVVREYIAAFTAAEGGKKNAKLKAV